MNHSNALARLKMTRQSARPFAQNNALDTGLLSEGELDSASLVGQQSGLLRNSPHSYPDEAACAGADKFSAVQASRNHIVLELDDGSNLILDDAGIPAEAATAHVEASSLLARLKLAGELGRIKQGLKTADGALARLKLAARANQIRVELGAGKSAAAPAAQPDSATPPDDAPQAPRNGTAQFYEFDPNRKPAQRKADNAAAMELLRRIDAGEADAARLTPDEKTILAKYSGTGGALIGADGKKGSAYEYYTPKPIAEGIWDLLAEEGFAGGKVLDPCAGVGIFGATAPMNAAIDSVELNETAGRVNALVNAGPGYTATVSAFEKVASSTPDEQYDAVVTNVPFGGVADRGGNQLLDDRYQKEPLQNYFILRALEKLRPGGLAVFITPPRCVSGKGGKETKLRVRASYMAEFLGAYRLPNEVFGTAA